VCVCGRSLSGIAGSNPSGSKDIYCQVEFSASGRSLVQRSPTESGVSDCDREASIMRGPFPLGAVAPLGWGGGRFHFENLTKPINTLSGKKTQFLVVN
jgi:hypothetical protein